MRVASTRQSYSRRHGCGGSPPSFRPEAAVAVCASTKVPLESFSHIAWFAAVGSLKRAWCSYHACGIDHWMYGKVGLEGAPAAARIVFAASTLSASSFATHRPLAPL